MFRFLLSTVCLTLLISACQTPNPHQNNSPLCRELRHQVIFSGATRNTNTAWKDRAEYDKINQMYRDENCGG